jgi:hypothetical protein
MKDACRIVVRTSRNPAITSRFLENSERPSKVVAKELLLVDAETVVFRSGLVNVAFKPDGDRLSTVSCIGGAAM